MTAGSSQKGFTAMPRVFRQSYSAPIPADAIRVRTTIKRRGKPVEVDAVKFKGADGKQVIAPLTSDGKRCLLPSPNWYGKVNGKAVPLCSNKTAAEVMLAELVKKASNRKAGIGDPFEEQTKKPLTAHLEDYRRELEARGRSSQYVDVVHGRLEALFTGCRFRFIPDLSASQAMDWLAQQRRDTPCVVSLPPGQKLFTRSEAASLLGISVTAFRDTVKRHRLEAIGKGPARRYPRESVEGVALRIGRGKSVQTTNYYISHLKSFCRWLIKDRRTGENPVVHLEPGNADTDRRRDRRELTDEQLRDLLTATRSSTRSYRGLTGNDRYHLYALACGTGFRASALASLTPECFDLEARVPTVTLPVRNDKSRRGKLQPLPSDVADLLRDYLQGRPGQALLWAGTGTWHRHGKGAEMLRLDLEAAGIPFVVQGPDGPLYADFHALRHTYLTLGGRAGIDLRTLQELAGHSTPTLTARYSHRRLHDLAGAVEKLPSFLPSEEEAPAQQIRATGTDGPISSPSSPQFPCPLLVQTSDRERLEMRGDEMTSDGRDSPPVVRNSHQELELRGIESDCVGFDLRGPSRIRTGDGGFAIQQPTNVTTLQDNTLRNSDNSLVLPLSSLPDDLIRIVENWGKLPLHIRVAINSLVQANIE